MFQNGSASMAGDDMSGVPPDMSGLMDDGHGMMPPLDIDMGMDPMDMEFASIDRGTQPTFSYNNPPGSQPHLQSQNSQNQHPPGLDPNDAYQQQLQNNMTAIGAGPLPTGFGMQPPNIAGSSTLTEFTKRRNWSQRVLEEIRDFLHILTPDGRILYVSPSSKLLTGYEPSQLLGHFIGEYIHPDDSGIFVREFNESIASGNALRFFYRFKKSDNTYTIFESHGHPHLSQEPVVIGSNNQSFCRGFFMMSRPYPTKNASLLDSFLEHKIENERLTKRIAELKREEQEEQEAADQQWKDAKGQGSATPSDSQKTDNRTDQDIMAQYNGMPPPAKPAISNTALTRQNLDEALGSQRPDSINDKMARYEGATHLETIEMITGLRYRDGERAQGISTGDTSPQLIRGDAGITILADRDNRGPSDKKKKLKVADEYVCTDCGTLDSPEWRKGPSGPKTLCNACGLRWAKKEKKRQSVGGGGQTPGLPLHNSNES